MLIDNIDLILPFKRINIFDTKYVAENSAKVVLVNGAIEILAARMLSKGKHVWLYLIKLDRHYFG